MCKEIVNIKTEEDNIENWVAPPPGTMAKGVGGMANFTLDQDGKPVLVPEGTCIVPVPASTEHKVEG
jgi:hypothetical protein